MGVLLERDSELGLLADLLEGVGSEWGRVVLVRGEAGIGKTALVRAFAAGLADSAHVLLGGCDDLLTAQPLGPFWDIVREEPSVREPLEGDDRHGVWEAVLHLLSRSLRPTVLVIEDTQWADEATLDAIKFLGRRIDTTNGLLVLTYRDEEVDWDHPLRGVIGELPPESVVRIRLGGLSVAAVASMLAGSSLDAAEVLAATGGNPFLVTEMASVDGEVVSSSVQDSVMARVGKLSSEAGETLRTLSVIPERISRGEVADLLGEAEGGVGECERRGLLEVGNEFVAFRHELIRRAVEGSLTESERVAANRAVLEILPPNTGLSRLVHHAHGAGDTDRLIELAPMAAAAAATVGSHREAVDHYRRLAPHVDRLAPDVKGPVLDQWAVEEGVLGYFSEAIRVNELARAHYRARGDRAAESTALAYEVNLCLWSGQRSRAQQLARRAIDVLGPDPAGSDLARALEANALLVGDSDPTAGLQLVERTLEAAGPDDEYILIRCLAHKGYSANIMNYPQGRVSLDEATRRAEAAGDWFEAARALINHADIAVEFRDFPTAEDRLQRGIALAVRHELSTGRACRVSARLLELKGEWSEAEDLARDALHREDVQHKLVILSVIGVIEARTGRPSARATLRQAWELAVDRDRATRILVAAPVAEHAWIAGEGDIPVFDIVAVMEAGLDAGYEWSTGSIALWLWKLGELAEAPQGIAEPYRLIIEGEPLAASAQWATIGCPYERAIALSHGDHAAQLEALEVFETLGATAVAAKHRKALRDQGIAVPRGRGRKTRRHAAGLTARQAEVLQLVAEGLSNPGIADHLFLSPRTVEHHVSALLAKLDATTRDEAVARARRRGLLTVDDKAATRR